MQFDKHIETNLPKTLLISLTKESTNNTGFKGEKLH